ncbi:CBS domain-containing protein [Streptomyces sp. NPDC097704]|uniref:CBS domain-containing protein n=1 Tax=Streptomyces sp. NPDC097704 TaxID=3157101 RepID=UPI003318E453
MPSSVREYQGRKGEPEGTGRRDLRDLPVRAHVQPGGPIVLVWDNLRIHLVEPPREFIAAHADWHPEPSSTGSSRSSTARTWSTDAWPAPARSRTADRPHAFKFSSVEAPYENEGGYVRRFPSGGSMPVAGQIMHRGAECINKSVTLTRAAEMMKRPDVGALPVCEDDARMHGIITDRDMVVKCIAEGRNPAETQCAELCQGTPQWIDVNADVSEVLATMERHQIKRLPVIEDKALVGMISEREIAQHLDEHQPAPRRASDRRILVAGVRDVLRMVRPACHSVR